MKLAKIRCVVLYEVHLQLQLFQTAELSCKAILFLSTLLKNTFYIFSSFDSKNLRKKLVLIRNVKPLEIVLDNRAAREISNGRGCCSRSTIKMLLLLVEAGGATMNIWIALLNFRFSMDIRFILAPQLQVVPLEISYPISFHVGSLIIIIRSMLLIWDVYVSIICIVL